MKLKTYGPLLVLLVLIPLPLFSGGAGEAAEEEDGRTTVTLGYNAFLEDSFTEAPAPIDVIRQAVEREHPDIRLEYRRMSDNMLEALTIMMNSRDDSIDIFGMDGPWVPQFAQAGWAVPLNDHIETDNLSITEAGLSSWSHEGNTLGIPFWGSVTGLYYRSDILAEYGFEPPQSPEDIVTIVETVREDNPEIQGFVWPGARDESLVMFYATLLHAFGGTYTDSDGNFAFDSAESVAAVEFIRRTIDDGISPRSVQNLERSESRQQFVNGNAIFSWDNQDIVTWLDDPEQSQIPDAWGLIPFPATENGESVSIAGGFAFSANPFGNSVDEAIRVLEVIAGEGVQKGFAQAWGPVQYYDGLYQQAEVLELNPNVDRIEALIETAISRPPSVNYAELSGMMQEELNAAVTGARSVEAALNNLSRRAAGLGAMVGD